MKRRFAIALLAVPMLMLGACGSPEQEAAEPSTTAAASQSTEAPTDAAPLEAAPTNPEVDLASYELGANTVLAEAGNAGYWFASDDSKILCTIITEGAANAPYVNCQTFPPFPVQEQACDAGSFAGTEATLTAEGAEYGKCQSDVPLMQMCLTDPASLDKSTAAFCSDNLLKAPVLAEGQGIATAGFSCFMGDGEVECVNESGDAMLVAPGE